MKESLNQNAYFFPSKMIWKYLMQDVISFCSCLHILMRSATQIPLCISWLIPQQLLTCNALLVWSMVSWRQVIRGTTGHHLDISHSTRVQPRHPTVHPTDEFHPRFKFIGTIDFVGFQIATHWSLQNFAHDTTAEWKICSDQLIKKRLTIKFICDLCVKNYKWHGSVDPGITQLPSGSAGLPGVK